MEAATEAPTRPVAVSATGLRKRYRLGEHRSLHRTAQRLVHWRRPPELRAFDALSGVRFTCYRGESMGFVGSNGSGKSTLLQILAGTTLPTDGEMRVHGRVVPLLAVGHGFHGELTGRENVMLFGASLGVPRRTIASRMEAVTEFAELERHMDTPVKRFSSGMVSRLSFAIAMQLPADIYIFDEVLAVVDTEFQERCLEEIKGLHRKGRTVLFVSHNRDQVEAVCERVVWLERGTVRDIGPTAEIMREYEHHDGAHES